MPDQNTPSNPFQRAPEPRDPRTSGLFASGHGHQSAPHDHSPESGPVRQPSRSNPPKISARREVRLKNLKLRRNILVGISITIGLLLALMATDTIKLGTGPEPSFSQSSGSITRPRGSGTKVEGEQVESLRALSAQDPLRVYIGGDSLVGSFGNILATDLGESGVIKATYDSRPSSGLVNTSFFNWNQHAKKMVSQYKPEIIFFMIGTNDASIVASNPKGYVQDYTKKLNNFLDIVSANNQKVFFVLAPAMRESALNKNVNKLNDVIYTVAHERGAETIEGGDTLSPSGSFVTSLKLSGKYVTVRSDDGVHISGDGGKLLSVTIANVLEKMFTLSSYSASPAIKAVKVPGCCTSPVSVPSGTTGTSTTTDSVASTTSTTTSSTTSTTEPISLPEDPDV